VGEGGTTANSPSKPPDVIDVELAQRRLALSRRVGNVTSLLTHLAQRCQCIDQQLALIVA